MICWFLWKDLFTLWNSYGFFSFDIIGILMESRDRGILSFSFNFSVKNVILLNNSRSNFSSLMNAFHWNELRTRATNCSSLKRVMLLSPGEMDYAYFKRVMNVAVAFWIFCSSFFPHLLCFHSLSVIRFECSKHNLLPRITLESRKKWSDTVKIKKKK